jgi:hypothetical protein
MAKRSFVQTDNTKFVRDVSSLALINTNEAEFLRYRAKREKSAETERLSLEVTSLKSELSEIKGMLLKVLNNG